MAVPIDTTISILNAFNKFHPMLQFTLEVGGNHINFLDTTIILDDNKIKFDWYHKPTYSGRYLNYWSQHPMSQKRGTILSLVDRAFLLSHPEFHQKNLEFVIKNLSLINNDYPLNVIFKVMTDRVKSLINRKTLKQQKISTDTTNEQQTTKWFTIPYISTFSEKCRNVIADTSLKLSFHSLNKLSKFINVHKDPLPSLQKKNVVYKIHCNDYDASYVGQRGRLLKTSISEHQSHIRRNTPTTSVITNHRMQLNHEFD